MNKLHLLWLVGVLAAWGAVRSSLVAQPRVEPGRTYQMPLTDVRVALSGGYGELRPDHFHAGLDFKTDQTTGHPVHAFADGYVARIGINPLGYGMVVYVTHPDLALMTVYAHLSEFNDAIWAKVRERQVRDSLNNADITFAPGELPVRQGDVIALSGNTGSSGGPHVHFEVRGLESRPGADDEEWYDPMPFFLGQIRDTQPPRVLALYLYPQPGAGVADERTMTAWGRIGIGLKAYDYMDGVTNKYGVKHLRLYQLEPGGGERLIYRWDQHFFQYPERRYVNSSIDFAAWRTRRSMQMKAFVEPGNRLRMIDHGLGDGLVTIDAERDYRFRFELEDAHGNVCCHPFTVRGVRRPIPAPTIDVGIATRAGEAFSVDSLGFHYSAAPGMLYTDATLPFRAVRAQRTPCVSLVYTLGSPLTPVHDFCTLAIDLPDSVADGRGLYVSDLDGSCFAGTFRPAVPAAPSAGGGRVAGRPARLETRVRQLGRFAVRRDTSLPVITLVSATGGRLVFTIDDDLTRIVRWRLLVDGRFVPLDKDNRARYVARPSLYGVARGASHRVELTAWDLAGNRATFAATRTF